MRDQNSLEIVSSYKPLRDQNDLDITLQGNKVTIIAPTPGQTDFALNALYKWAALSPYEVFLLEVGTDNTFTTLVQRKYVRDTELASEAPTGTYWMRVTGALPRLTDISQVTSVSISSGSTIDQNGSRAFNISFETTGSPDTSYTATGSGLTFAYNGNELTVTDVSGTGGQEKTFTVTVDNFQSVTASRTLTVSVEAPVTDDPEPQADSVTGDFNALIDLRDVTGVENWTNNTGWATMTESTMGDAFGVEVYPAGHQWAGRVKSLDLRNNNLVNVETYSGDSTYPDGNPVIYDLGGNVIDTNVLSGIATDYAVKHQERYKVLPGKELKRSIGALKKCESFNINCNLLGGKLPTEIFTLTECKWLVTGYPLETDERDNDVIGGVYIYPTKSSRLYNKFEGRIHPTIKDSMPNLVGLYMCENYFDDTNPFDFLWDMPSLKYIAVLRNGFTGQIPQRTPVWPTTIELLHYHGTTAHSSRVAGDESLSHPNQKLITGSLSEGVGFCTNLLEHRYAYHGWTGNIPQSWENLERVREFSFKNLPGQFPFFINSVNHPVMSTFQSRFNGFTTENESGVLQGLPSDFNISNCSGIYDIAGNFIGGETPLTWRDDPSEPDGVHALFPRDLQIFNFNESGMSGAFITDLSVMGNLRNLTMHTNDITSEIFQGFPDNNRFRFLGLSNNNFFGVLKATNVTNTGHGDITSPEYFRFAAENCEISGYEQGFIKAVTFDGSGNYTGGHRRLDGLYLAENQLSQSALDQIILDVKALIESRKGTVYERGINVRINNQKTGATPSNTTLINDAIAWINDPATGDGSSITV